MKSPPVVPMSQRVSVRAEPSSSAAQPIRTQELFGAHRELVIEHAGCLYRLRITQNNKLILTK